ncbi:MAG: L,D-transpeptidase [Chloroflexi bacterium]|nr:L,D-transpeptidase [Chloroflexota bacterium]
MKVKWLVTSITLVSLIAALLFFSASTAEADTGWTGVVTVATLNVRPEPSTLATPVDTLRYGDTVTVEAVVEGEAVMGDATWYQIGPGRYVYGPFIAEGQGGGASYGDGERWIDVDLSNKVARAMVGDKAVYAAEVTIGRPGWNTPVGTFSIVNRVASETMDSATIGIPRDSPDGYYLTEVLYTQYFLWTGQAFHYNYWVPDEAFGTAASSRGCVGLRLADAEFFWNFADIGTRVVIHY